MTFRIKIDDWSTLKADAQQVRQAVFIVEQKIPVELEWDDMDEASLHAVAYDEDTAIGTARLLPDGHVGRMAVLMAHRSAGVGGAILTALMQEAKKRDHHEVVLNAQIQVRGFYERFGFVGEGEAFMDAEIPHILMKRIV